MIKQTYSFTHLSLIFTPHSEFKPQREYQDLGEVHNMKQVETDTIGTIIF